MPPQMWSFIKRHLTVCLIKVIAAKPYIVYLTSFINAIEYYMELFVYKI